MGSWRRVSTRPDHFTGRVEAVSLDVPDTLTEGVWTVVATTLAMPLRKAFHDHLDAHGCGCPISGCADPRHAEGHLLHGFGHCPEAWHLFRLQPEGDQVLLG